MCFMANVPNNIFKAIQVLPLWRAANYTLLKQIAEILRDNHCADDTHE